MKNSIPIIPPNKTIYRKGFKHYLYKQRMSINHMPAKKRAFRPARKQAFRANQGTIWFLGILIVSAVAVFSDIEPTTAALVLGIFGAIVAILNITAEEETKYLVATTALIVIIMTWRAYMNLPDVLSLFLHYLVIGFSVSGFVVALALIAKLGLTR